ncbi:quinol dehydrogenase ferredoxin subunit NapH [uncultured Sutterella sp.]|uniref:quinol dehydrogenase ferredoxin subunit NapH n=1 Tax=uncultured Sutterella sp. TaxID=286133 RepID=UPI00260B13AE|nr:quinol dehydrogenase ferredoxin subunit NapH [uncultured Sutterella sp.]
MTQQTFMRRHRFTIARRVTELLVLILFAGSARLGWEIAGKPLLLGDLSQSKILGIIPLGDPLAFLERLLAGIIPTATTLIGTALITLFYSLLGSRTFCGWVCPMNLVVEAAEWLRTKFDLSADYIRLPRGARYAVLAGTLAASFATGTAAFESVSPQAIIWRDVVYGTGLSALSAALAVFALELGLMRNGWCGHLCPLGAFWSLAGRASPRPLVTIAFSDEKCTRCADCLRVCPEKQIIRFKDMAETGRIPSGECLNCGRCIEVCPEDALHFRIPGLPASKNTHKLD